MSTSPTRPKCSAVPRPVLPQHSRGVRVVHHQHRIVAAAELEQIRQRGDRALHREHAVRDHQPGAAVLRRGELRVEIGEVRVLVHGRLALGDRLGEPRRIDDRRVIELIADHDVLLAEQRGRDRLVGVPRADEAQGRPGPDQARARGLECPMHRVRPADEPHRGGARSPAIQRGLAGRDHLGLRAQPEIVVRREDDDLAPALHRDARGSAGCPDR